MKRIVFILVCTFCVLSTVFAQDVKKKKESATFFIEAMDCDHCVKKIENKNWNYGRPRIFCEQCHFL